MTSQAVLSGYVRKAQLLSPCSRTEATHAMWRNLRGRMKDGHRSPAASRLPHRLDTGHIHIPPSLACNDCWGRNATTAQPATREASFPDLSAVVGLKNCPRVKGAFRFRQGIQHRATTAPGDLRWKKTGWHDLNAQPGPTQPERDAAWGPELARGAKRWSWAGAGQSRREFDWLSAESHLKSQRRPTAFSQPRKAGRFGSASPP